MLAAFLWCDVALAGEVLETRSTDLRLSDWTRMAESDRPWFLTGFALGWHGEDTDAPALALGDAQAAYAPVAARLARQVVADPSTRLVGVLTRALVAGRLPLAAVSGADWIALDPAPRLALLHGFHGGAYARALWDGLGAGAPDAALDGTLAEARRRVKPPLAFAPSLLFARLSDYYFYTDRRVERLVDSIAVIAAQIRGP